LLRLADLGAFVSGVVAGASSALGAAKLVLIRPLENRVDDVEDDVDDVKKVAEKAQKKAQSNERAIFGDEDDPNHSGVAQDVADMKETIEHVEEMMEEVRDDE